MYTAFEQRKEISMFERASGWYEKVVNFGDFIENIDRVFNKFVNSIHIRRYEFSLAIRDFLDAEAFHLYTKNDLNVDWDEEKLKLSKDKEWSIYIYKNTPLKIYWSTDDETKIVFPINFNINQIVEGANRYVKIDKETNITDNFASETFYYSEAQKSIVKSIQFWLSKRDWFMERGIPYKRTYLLKGPPGTGKSCFIKRVANVVNYQVTQLDVMSRFGTSVPRSKKMMNMDEDYDEPTESKDTGLTRGRQILVVEDLDRIDLDKVRMDKFMNYLQGSQSSDGMICFITCNNDMAFPDALLRAGRIDKEVTFGRFEDEGLLFIARKVFNEERKQEILSRYKERNKEILTHTESKIAELTNTEVSEDKRPELKEKVEQLAKDKDRLLKEIYTPAHFEKYCVDIAIEEFEEEAKKIV